MCPFSLSIVWGTIVGSVWIVSDNSRWMCPVKWGPGNL